MMTAFRPMNVPFRPILPLAVAALAAGPARGDAIDDYVKAEMGRRHIAGISIAVVKDGQVLKTAAYGLADVELDVPVSPRSVFQIQSITKTFTAAAILLLRGEGKLSLEDPIGKHLPGTPETWKEITLRHLLTHTSGIKDFINEPTASLRLDVTEEEVLEATAPRPLNFQPGERYAYSNTNYHLLAMVIRKLTGQWYGDFLAERIFRPLEMADTRVVRLSALIPGRVSGYHWRDGEFRNGEFVAESILSYGGGGIVSTAPDMAKWAMAFESGRIIDRAAIEEAWAPARLNDGRLSGYGLGWGTESIEGHRCINHSGGHITGFVSYLGLYPDDGIAVVVLANTNTAQPGAMARRIAATLAPALAPAAPKPIEDREPEVTALLRECLAGAAEWKLDPAKFTPECWALVSGQRVAVQPLVKGLGAVQSVDLLSRSESGGSRTYRYRVVFANGPVGVRMTLTGDGKIAAISASDD